MPDATPGLGISGRRRKSGAGSRNAETLRKTGHFGGKRRFAYAIS